jgi:putative Mg2+ transporter-C (MgtC) family protein
VTVDDTTGIVRLLVTFGLTFALGFERQLRGSPAGNRTFSLIGLGAAVIGLLSESVAPNALAGAVTGVGFIGAGLVFRQKTGRSQVVRGVTTASAIFATAAIGAAAGEGRLLVATVGTALVLISLELPHVPVLRFLDAARYEARFTPDNPPPAPHHPLHDTD